jgi:hypothetical protein
MARLRLRIAVAMGVFYEQVAEVKVCFCFFLHWVFAVVVVFWVATHVVLHRVSIRTLGELV